MKSKPEVLKVVEEFDIIQRRTELSLIDINKTIVTLNKNVMNVRKQVQLPPLHDNDHFSDQMKAFSTSASEEMQTLRDRYKNADNTYKQLCMRFGEDPSKVAPTDFFGYIVSFMNCLKTSHKHYLDVQAEEKLKKVAHDWQALTLTISQNRSSRNASPAPTPTSTSTSTPTHGVLGKSGAQPISSGSISSLPKKSPPPHLPSGPAPLRGQGVARSNDGQERPTPPPFRLPPTTAANQAGVSTAESEKKEVEGKKTGKKASLWTRLMKWGKE